MTNLSKSLSAALMLTTATLGSAASADVTINGDTGDGGYWLRPDGPSTCCTGSSATSLGAEYQAHQITISDPASFIAVITSAYIDSYIFLYQGAFDHLNPDNWVAEDDDGGVGLYSLISSTNDGPFVEDNYTLVVSTWGHYDGGAYLLKLFGAILGWAPITAKQLDESLAVMSDTARNNLNQTNGSIRGSSENSFATRDAVVFSTKDASALMGNVYAWVKGSVLFQRDTALSRTFRAPLLQIGADVGFGDDIIAGLSFGTGDLYARSADFSFEGTQTLVQPYLSWRQGDWHGDASLTYGKIDYDTITTLLGAAGVEGELMAFSGEIGRDFAIAGQESTYLTPFIGVDVGQVELTATSGTLAGIGLGSKVSFNEFSLGTKLTHNFDGGSFVFGISADNWHTDAPTALFGGTHDTNGWSGSTSFELNTQLNENTTMGAGLEFGGIGTSRVSYTGSVSLAIQF